MDGRRARISEKDRVAGGHRSYQASSRPSRKKPPVGPSSSSVTPQTTLAAPSATGRPPPPPMSVAVQPGQTRSEEHTSELQSQSNLVCRLLLEKKNKTSQDGLRRDVDPPHKASQRGTL